MIQALKDLDTQLLLLINGLHNSVLDVCMSYASAKFFWIPLYLVFLFLLFKNYKSKTFFILIFIALTIALSDQIVLHFFKNVFLRYRPCHNLLLAAKVHLVDDCGGSYGFISSHAANAFALATFLFSFLKQHYKYAWLLFAWAALVCYSRIYLGQHYPADVALGALVGIACGKLILKVYFYFAQRFFSGNKISPSLHE